MVFAIFAAPPGRNRQIAHSRLIFHEMSLKLRWVGEEARDRVGEIRALCYARAAKEVPDFIKNIREHRTSGPGDWLLAERDGAAVGTATSIPLTMWVRSGSVPCQGVAYVGTVKTSRRRSGTDPGVGTALMKDVLRKARERECVVSALMPFRGSYYDHFGYGVVERRADWTVPLSIIPDGDFDGVRFYDTARDREALVECRQRIAQRGQCDIERSAAAWNWYLGQIDEGFMVIDRHGDGPIRGWMAFAHVNTVPAGPDTVKAEYDTAWEDAATLKRFLHFLGSLRDQYSFATMQLPRDLPLNLLLKETQMTHRSARNHPTAEMRPFTRMQVRVLDHVKLIDAMKLLGGRAGKIVVAIKETEGTETKLEIEVKGGKVTATPSNASADVEMTDRIWAMVALGDLRATQAAELGLISVTNRTPLAVLDSFSLGPAPYCREYF